MDGLRRIATAHGQKVLLPVLLVSLFYLPLLAGHAVGPDFNGQAVYRSAPTLKLPDTRGRPTSLTEFHGRYVYLMFGYLGCERVCHTQTLTLKTLWRQLQLDTQAPKIAFVYVGMDPEHDSPGRVEHYFGAPGSGFTGLVPRNVQHAQQIAADFGAHFAVLPQQAGSVSRISHPGHVYLIDPAGRIRLVYTGDQLASEAMADDLKQLVRMAT